MAVIALFNAFPDQCHAHTTRAATAANQLAAFDLDGFDASLTQATVGSFITVIDDDPSRSYTEGVGAVIPLFAGSGTAIAAAGEDHPHAADAQGFGEGRAQIIMALIDQLDVYKRQEERSIKIQEKTDLLYANEYRAKEAEQNRKSQRKERDAR